MISDYTFTIKTKIDSCATCRNIFILVLGINIFDEADTENSLVVHMADKVDINLENSVTVR